MQVKSVRATPGSKMKVVTFSHVEEVNDKAVISAALVAAGENQSSIFGSSVAYFLDDEELDMSAAVVTLWID